MKSFSFLFILLFGLTFTSCSDDDSDENSKQELKSIESEYYEGGELVAKSIFSIVDDRFDRYSSYNPNEEIIFYQDFIYQSNNNLERIETYSANGILSGTFSITYDNQNRIIETKNTNTQIELVTFTYTNNTITSLKNNSETKIFGLNSDGLIYTENETEIVVQYDGLKVISMTTVDGTTSYKYHETGINPILMYNILGNLPNNDILFYNSLDSGGLFAKELLLEKNSPYTLNDYVYTLNEENYPLTMNIMNSDGIIGQKSEFIYE